MRILLISYDLKDESKKYIADLSAIIKTAPYWWHYLENIWLIKTDETPKYWYEKIIADKFKEDSFLIVEISPTGYWGRLPREAWEWFTNS